MISKLEINCSCLAGIRKILHQKLKRWSPNQWSLAPTMFLKLGVVSLLRSEIGCLTRHAFRSVQGEACVGPVRVSTARGYLRCRVLF